MSLVDYASSDDDEAGAEVREEENRESLQVPKEEPEVPKHDQPPPLPPQKQRSLSSNEQPGNSHSSEPSLVKLPDASVLLSSPNLSSQMVSGPDHSSRVAAIMAERASRKRQANELSSALPRSKSPKGNLRHSRSVPDTAGGLLVPPQLRGRSNIVTEDVSKLFVRKNAEPSSE
ncbi:hypothetical protein NMG60_11029532 [Bertholletia excelsa]